MSEAGGRQIRWRLVVVGTSGDRPARQSFSAGPAKQPRARGTRRGARGARRPEPAAGVARHWAVCTADSIGKLPSRAQHPRNRTDATRRGARSTGGARTQVPNERGKARRRRARHLPPDGMMCSDRPVCAHAAANGRLRLRIAAFFPRRRRGRWSGRSTQLPNGTASRDTPCAEVIAVAGDAARNGARDVSPAREPIRLRAPAATGSGARRKERRRRASLAAKPPANFGADNRGRPERYAGEIRVPWWGMNREEPPCRRSEFRHDFAMTRVMVCMILVSPAASQPPLVARYVLKLQWNPLPPHRRRVRAETVDVVRPGLGLRARDHRERARAGQAVQERRLPEAGFAFVLLLALFLWVTLREAVRHVDLGSGRPSSAMSDDDWVCSPL